MPGAELSADVRLTEAAGHRRHLLRFPHRLARRIQQLTVALAKFSFTIFLPARTGAATSRPTGAAERARLRRLPCGWETAIRPRAGSAPAWRVGALAADLGEAAEAALGGTGDTATGGPWRIRSAKGRSILSDFPRWVRRRGKWVWFIARVFRCAECQWELDRLRSAKYH